MIIMYYSLTALWLLAVSTLIWMQLSERGLRLATKVTTLFYTLNQKEE